MCSLLFSTKKIDNVVFVNEFLQKRGPDNTTVIDHNGHTFIHNLLSMTGSFTTQPLFENNCAVLFNGEIYNYQTFGEYDNDSKCLIPLYNKYGINFTKHLDGEFAICLIDYSKNEIIVSTDIFATKPLWIYVDENDISVSSYESGLLRQGFDKSKIEKIPANTTRIYDLNTKLLKQSSTVYEFDLNQHKTSFSDWNKAFAESIRKRANPAREPIFIGLSSGYDSGVIACELHKQHIDFKAYTLSGTENNSIIYDRYKILNIKYLIVEKAHVLNRGKDHINKNVEEFMYRTYTSRSSYNEFDLRLHDDNGSSGISVVCALGVQENGKILLSGQGADEIFSDYGFDGQSKYQHSNFGGLFPKDLKTIFPWPSFYGSSMISYLAKEEYIGGSYGIECRYPFLDKMVVQEFLWLTSELKNSFYKSVLHNYLKENNFPFEAGRKIGF